jgi:hypothetical protein
VRLSHLSLLKTERASPNKSEADTGQAMYESPPNNSTESLLPRELWVRGLVCVCVFVCVCVYVCVCVCNSTESLLPCELWVAGLVCDPDTTNKHAAVALANLQFVFFSSDR